ncbi:hypothetical protein EMPS_03369 [Entomortierella parvispora]|uniref:Uncharacterized protein n=1 Tax=Entomortierella parvispora TaxID=205924 RepID=A0A9P3LUK2_9FUNG|nr:hypothetical protein EMPS_03369 [Entomortierella parvispora]
MVPMVDNKTWSNNTKLAQEMKASGPSLSTRRRTWHLAPVAIMSTLIPACVWFIQHVLRGSDSGRFSGRHGEIDVIPGILSFRRLGLSDDLPPSQKELYNQKAEVHDNRPSLVPTLTLEFEGISLTVVIVSIVGVFAFIKGCRKLLQSYLICVIITVLIQASIMVHQFLLSTRWIDDTLDQSWNRAYESDPELVMGLQNEFNCRGFNHFQDRAVDFIHGEDMIDHMALMPCSEVLKATFGKRMRHLGTVLLCIRLIQLAGVLSLATLIVYLSDMDQEDREMEEQEQELADEKEVLVSLTLDVKQNDKP